VELGLKSRVALVTAASRGLGRACALALAAEGARVAVAARDRAALEALVGEIEAHGSEGLAIPLDLTDGPAIHAATELIGERWGGIEILVVNAPGPPSGPFERISLEDWKSALDMNVLSAVRLLHEVLPGMRARRWGRVVFISTVGVKTAQPNMVLSNATRLAVAGIAKTVSLETAADNVLLNVVAPGPIETDRMVELIEATARRDGLSVDAARQRWLEDVPLGRMGRPEDVSSLVVLLCSDPCSFMTGAIVPVDGGKAHGY
jgi:3-oxoacyl-[acyl-carrier protein] reductase